MGSPPLVVGQERTNRPPRRTPKSGRGFLVVMAVALILVGLTDLFLAMYPGNFGNADWRFSVLASVATGLPMLGVGILVVSAIALGGSTEKGAALAMGLNGVVLVGILAASIGFLTAAGGAFERAPVEVHLGLQKAIAKSVVFFAAFALAHGAALVTSARVLQQVGPLSPGRDTEGA